MQVKKFIEKNINGFKWGMLCLLATSSVNLFANPELIKDVDTIQSPLSSNPADFIEAGGIHYFSAETLQSGRELWATNGVDTWQVKDIYPGHLGSNPESIAVVGETLFFTANDGVTGRELWATDGAETWQVSDIYPGYRDSQPEFVTVFKETLYFTANDGVTGKELWASDGSAAWLIKDMYPGQQDSNVQLVATIGNILYFKADTRDAGDELWVSDGSIDGTVRVKGFGALKLSKLAIFNEQLIFKTYDNTGYQPGNRNVAIWKSNGTVDGTQTLTESINYLYSEAFIVVENNFYFGRHVTGFPESSELWKSDGTLSGTALIRTFDHNVDGGYINDFSTDGHDLYFEIYNYLGYGPAIPESWKSDGTFSGTVTTNIAKIKTISIENDDYQIIFYGHHVSTDFDVYTGGTLYKVDASGSTQELAEGLTGEYSIIDGILYFTTGVYHFGRPSYWEEEALWKTDGTVAGTIEATRPEDQRQTGYFSGSDDVHGTELWYYNGSVEELFTNIQDDAFISNPSDFIAVNNLIYFLAGPESVRSLWVVEGTDIRQVSNGDTHVDSGSLTPAGDVLFFTGAGSLCKSDGTVQGTRRVKSIVAEQLTAVGSDVYFRANNDVWKSDGTDAGTVQINDIYPGQAGTQPESLTAWGQSLFYSALDAVGARDLWKIDGSSSGAEPVISTVYPKYLISVGAALYFSGSNSDDNHTQLFKYDGVTNHELIHDFSPSVITSITRAENHLYILTEAANGINLWLSDGTATGTQLLREFSSDRALDLLTVTADKLFFRVKDIISGSSVLWVSDGSISGTFPIKTNLDIASPAAVGDSLFFVAYDAVSGEEVWVSDGTATGTQVAFDLLPGIEGSNPVQLTGIGSSLYFSANNGATGQEPWRYTEETIAPPPTNPQLENERNNALEILEARGFDSARYDAYLAEINAANSVSVLDEIIVRMRADSGVTTPPPSNDPRVDNKRGIALSVLEARGFVTGLHAAYLTEINAAGSVSALHAIIVRMRADSGVTTPPPSNDPRFDNKRSIALSVLEAKGFAQGLHDAYLTEINAASSVSALHTIIVRMRADSGVTTPPPSNDPRFDTKRSVALGVLEARGFSQGLHDAYLAEINAASSVSELHRIILRMRS